MLLQTRFIRLRDAPYYLGMANRLFNKEVRPCLIQIPIGGRGIAFDRLDLEIRGPIIINPVMGVLRLSNRQEKLYGKKKSPRTLQT